MTQKARKGKMISLRLSEAQYEALHALYPAYGARNVSDFARLALQRVIGNPNDGDDPILVKIHDLEGRVKSIESRFAALLEGDLVHKASSAF